MKRIITILSFALFCFAQFTYSQNPSIGIISNQKVIVNSGANQILIPNVSDGENETEDITFTVVSSNVSLLSVNSVDFTAGDQFAVINVTEKGTPGTVTITVDAEDPDGSAPQRTFDVDISAYDKPGLKFELHDIVFWQETVPLNGVGAWDTIISDGAGAWPYINWNMVLPLLTVDDQCVATVCSGQDFMTAFYRGYVIPPTSGSYTFIMKGSDMDKALWLSTDADFINADPICYGGDKNSVGTVSGDEIHSAPQYLVAGQVYAIYATQWIIHTKEGGIQWSGPGITQDYIDGQYLMYNYDPVFPTAPTNLALETRGTEYFRISWTEGTDDKILAGHNIYVNGVKVNTEPVDGNIYKITGLSPDTKYSIVVTAEDNMGNISSVSNTVNVTTWINDGINPTPPTSLTVDTESGTALEVSWTGATDGQTEVVGYNIYIDGNLYNTDDLIYETNTILKPLDPSTTYDITIEAVDAAGNISSISSNFPFTTTKFDPFGADLGVKKARLNIEMENITWSEGFGINFEYSDGISDTEMDLMRELGVGYIRCSATDVNLLNFSEYHGTGQTVTFGDLLDACIELNAWGGIMCGVNDVTDWRQDQNTFLHFLEYVNGTSGTYANRRIAEGYSDPFVPQLKGLIFEFGNEVWGGNAHDAPIGTDYEVYGAWCRQMATLMKADANWNNKIKLTYSGRGPVNDYGLHDKLLTDDQGEVNFMAISGYLGGNLNYDPEIDPGKSELDYYKNGIGMMIEGFNGLEALKAKTLNMTGEMKGLHFYEGNMSTPAYNGRLGQGVVQCDYYAGAITHGNALPTIYNLSRGGQWTITQPTNGYKRLPLFYTAKFFNRFCKGHVLETTVESNYTIETSNGVAIDCEPVGAYAYTNGTDFSVAFFSRDFENDYYVDINLPDDFNYNSTGWQYIISGTDFNTYDATIDSVQITAFADSFLVRVPKYSMVLVHFTGEDQELIPYQPGEYGFKKLTGISIVSDTVLTGEEENLFLDVELYPSDALSSTIKWEVISGGDIINHSNYPPNAYLLQSKTSCDDAGTVVVRASSLSDPSIYDEVSIYVDPCGTGYSNSFTNDENTQFDVYPNPAKNTVFINNKTQTTGLVSVYNIQGQLILKQQLSEGTQALDIESFENGIYILNLQTGENIKTLSIVKK